MPPETAYLIRKDRRFRFCTKGRPDPVACAEVRKVVPFADGLSEAQRGRLAKGLDRMLAVRKADGDFPVIDVGGLVVVLDRPRGFVQRGIAEDGTPWEREYTVDYGFFPGTLAPDGEEVDAYVGDVVGAPTAWIFTQLTDAGLFDEYKVMLQFGSAGQALTAYLDHVPLWCFGGMVEVPVDFLAHLLATATSPQVALAKMAPPRRARGVRKGSDFLAHARQWLTSRGMFDADADYGGELGQAVMRMAEGFAGEGHSGMSAQWSRALFNWICDGWEGTHTMILNDDDYAAVREVLASAERVACAAVAAGEAHAVSLARVAKQRFDSAATSRAIVPALFTAIDARGGWTRGTSNVDLGGGRFELGTEYLKERGVDNLVVDPFNRSPEHNAAAVEAARRKPPATVTCSNVLNVIQEPEERLAVVQRSRDLLPDGGVAYFSVYHDPGAQAGRTRDGWQEQRPLESYLPEVRQVFPTAAIEGSYIRGQKAIDVASLGPGAAAQPSRQPWPALPAVDIVGATPAVPGVAEGLVCAACDGDGSLETGTGKSVACGACGGTGGRDAEAVERARAFSAAYKEQLFKSRIAAVRAATGCTEGQAKTACSVFFVADERVRAARLVKALDAANAWANRTATSPAPPPKKPEPPKPTPAADPPAPAPAASPAAPAAPPAEPAAQPATTIDAPAGAPLPPTTQTGDAWADHPAMTEGLTGEYATPENVGGWLGWIEPPDGSWIAFVSETGHALLWTQREPDGGVVGDPVEFDRPDLAAPTAKSRLRVRFASRGVGDGVCAIRKDVFGPKRLVGGVVLEPNPNDGRGDAQKHTYTADDIEEAAHWYMQHAGLDDQHGVFLDKGTARVVESHVVQMDGYRFGDQVLKAGTWIMVVKILTDEAWAKVERGEWNAFSVEGYSRTERL